MAAPAPSIAPVGILRPEPATAAAWLLGFAPVVLLALDGGGYDIVVRSEVGLLCWWLILLGVIVGVLPRNPLRPAAWGVLALFGALVFWTWLGADWSASAERSLSEAGRVAAYGGVLVLGLGLIDRENLTGLIDGLACAIGLVAALAVLSRLAPAWFPADPGGGLVTVARLIYPFNYADAVGEFAALGLPLLLHVSLTGRARVGRALGLAALPPIAVCVTMSVSRGGALACLVGLALFFGLHPRGGTALVSGAVAAGGSAVAVLALLSRPSLRAGLQRGPTLSAERHQMLVILAAVGLVLAAVRDGLDRLGGSWRAPARATTPTPGRARAAAVMGAAALALSIGVLTGSGEAGHLWREFQQPYVGAGDVYSRLLTISGSHRYQYWQAAVSAWHSSPWRGIGPGTFEFWWAQHNSLAEFVRNAHSLYFETLAELGVVGLALLAAILAVTLGAGARPGVSAPAVIRSALAAAIAGFGGFAAAAGFDWVWQFAAIPIVGLLLAAAALAGDRTGEGAGIWPRVVLGLAVVPASLAIAVPLATTVAVRSSQAAAQSGNFGAALGDLVGAERLEPAAASPRLQRALIYEQAGALPAANQAIGEALRSEPINWRIWLVASRLAAEDGRPGLAVSEYRRARALNPTSTIFR